MKTTVQKAYVFGTTRALVDSKGRVYVPQQGWVTMPDNEIKRVAGPAYEKWSDVPAAWLGGCPYWS
jgi:hypothetical protein